MPSRAYDCRCASATVGTLGGVSRAIHDRPTSGKCAPLGPADRVGTNESDGGQLVLGRPLAACEERSRPTSLDLAPALEPLFHCGVEPMAR